jgi:hypothetical protein
MLMPANYGQRPPPSSPKPPINAKGTTGVRGKPESVGGGLPLPDAAQM